jgi:hypothetical protein
VNPNIFGHYFGVEFRHNDHSYVCAVLPFKFVLCFHLLNKITYKLSHPSNTFCLDAAVPALTSARVFEHILKCCLHIWSRNFKIFQPNKYAAPAACIQAFLNGAIGVRLPNCEQWSVAYQDDPQIATIIQFVKNPGTIL